MFYYPQYRFFVKKTLQLAILFLSVFLISSCASTQNKVYESQEVYLTEKAVVNLLPTEATNQDIQMFQSLTGSYGNQNFQMNAFLILNPKEINVTLMNSMGTTMGSLLYTSTALEFESSVLPENIHPAYIVFDFQLCFYNEDMLRQELARAGLELKVASVSGQQLREVYEGDRLIITILQNKDKIEFMNIYRNYSYTIQGDFNEVK